MEKLRADLLAEIDATFAALYKIIAEIGAEQFNTVPFSGSWTAGQVLDHITLSISALPDSTVKACERPYDSHVAELRRIFLDFGTKMQSPDFILPQKSSYTIPDTLAALQAAQSMMRHKAQSSDLTALCMDFEFPYLDYLSRYEWLNFFLFHTQRHSRQLQGIRDKLYAIGV